MKKGILIIGNKASGKSYLSKLLTSETPKENVHYIAGRRTNLETDTFKYQHVHKKTSVVLVDDVNNMKNFHLYVNAVKQQSITVHRLGDTSFEINTRIIMNCDEEMTDEILKDFDSKYADYFQLINTSEPLKIIEAMVLMDAVTHSLDL
jgi:adenosyl cobinamide kinase/adenosyl cobinamide phosphate guanylyltransferase